MGDLAHVSPSVSEETEGAILINSTPESILISALCQEELAPFSFRLLNDRSPHGIRR